MKSIAAFVLGTFVLSLALLAQAPAQRGPGRGGRGGNQAPTGPQNLAWVDRTGKVLGTVGQPQAAILDPSISPDGTKVVVRGRDTPRTPRCHGGALPGRTANGPRRGLSRGADQQTPRQAWGKNAL